MAAHLEFEQPIIELEEKIAALQRYSESHAVDLSQGMELLEQQLSATREKLFAGLSAWEKVQLARHPQRPYPQDYIRTIFSDYLELHGDRGFADDRAIVGGFAKLKGRKVMVIATQKGRNLKQNLEVNFGSAQPEGYRKALRLMKLADKVRCPIITLIDTPGAYPGIAAEERHIGEAIAMNLREMFRLRVPLVCAITGEGGSGGALGLCVGNRVLIMECAYYSVITPEGCAAILWRAADAVPKAADALKLTSHDLLKHGIVDGIIHEPVGGAHRDPQTAAEFLRDALDENLSRLTDKSEDELRNERYERFRKIGRFREE
jgi:acetyl-CoA carboxylase carboxyl transferase subunit alpha